MWNHVAKYADLQTPPFHLPKLNENGSLSLFIANAFPRNDNKTPSCPGQLDDVALQLVRRCGGLPLALVVLARLLLGKPDNPITWMGVAETMDWSAKEDEEIYSYNVTRMWIAEGFIPESEKQALEDTAQEYLEELARRSMIQVGCKDWEGRVAEFRIHDLFRNMCLAEAAEIGYLRVLDSSSHDGRVRIDQDVHRLAIHVEHTETESWLLPCSLRSLLTFSGTINNEIIHGLELLRVLHLHRLQDSGERVPIELLGNLIVF